MICRLAIACLILLTAQPTLSGEGVTHWALRPVEKPPLPEVDNKAWIKNPIDLFVLARLEEADLEPSPRLPPVICSGGFSMTSLACYPDQTTSLSAPRSPSTS